MIKAIPTIYNGQKYRSKLEAEYAKGMDEAGVKFIYEPEGFVFSDGTKYLPDFYLPDFGVFIEVKGIMTDYDQKKINLFREEIGSPLYVADGQDLSLSKTYNNLCIYENKHFMCMCEDDEKHKKFYEKFVVWRVDGDEFVIHFPNGEDSIYLKDDYFIYTCPNCHKFTLHSNEDCWHCGHCGYYDGGHQHELVFDSDDIIIRRSYIDYRNNK